VLGYFCGPTGLVIPITDKLPPSDLPAQRFHLFMADDTGLTRAHIGYQLGTLKDNVQAPILGVWRYTIESKHKSPRRHEEK